MAASSDFTKQVPPEFELKISEGLLSDFFELEWHKWDFKVSSFPFLNIEWVIGGVLFYIATVLIFMPPPKKVATAKGKPTTPPKKVESSAIQKFVLSSHNLLLCVFSACCFYNTFPIIYKLWLGGWTTAVCDGLIEKEYSDVFGYWAWLFYMSKFYEFADTWIVMWKGRRPIFLQVYHHIGAVIGCWLVLTSRCTCGYIFVVENSFIHSIMYFYYALTTWKIRVPFKFVITLLQMTQFFTGMGLGLMQLFGWGYCLRDSDKAVIWYHEIYVGLLWILFMNFYQKTYKSKKKQA